MSNVPRKTRRRKLAAGAAVALGAAIVPEAAAAVIPVNSTADTVAVDGSCTLREALQNANDDSAVNADCVAGSGLDTINFSGLTFPATIVLSGTSLPIADSTIIDGPGEASLTIDGNAASRIFTSEDDDSGTAIDVTIEGLTLTNGDATGEPIPGGGAIFSAETLTLTDVTITDSIAEAGGAVVHDGQLVGATLTVSNSTFTGNTAIYGGALHTSNGAVDIDNSTLSQNTGYLFGGAMLHRNGDFTLTGSVVSDNTAAIIGGIGLYYTGVTTISSTTISGNQATLGDAGGLYLYGSFGDVTIEDSVISGNEAANSAGGVMIASIHENAVVIRDTEISGNIAGNVTGGLYLYDAFPVTLERVRLINNMGGSYQGGGAIFGSEVTIIESEISGNSAEAVGGLYVAYNSYLYLINSTIANNTATTGPVGGLGINNAFAAIDVSTISGNSAPSGAAGNVFLYGGALYMGNSIIANGTAVAGPDLVTANATAVINESLIEDPSTATFSGTDNITGVDPQLGPLQNNGGPTQTMKPAPASPVVNAGAEEFTTPANDQRGYPRPVGIVDMGALELNPGVITLSSATYLVNEAAGFITITVNRTGGIDGEVTVQYTTASGTATSGADFTATSGMLSWADNESSPKMFNIPITNDVIFEGNETFNVTLNTPTGGATLGTAAAVVTIQDNDSAPTILIGDGGATEGNAGTTPATFTVSLSNPTTQTVTVDFTTAGVTAVSGTDFQPSAGTITFNPLVTSLQVNVNVIGDTIDEPNETFTVTLANPTNATIADGSATGTITDDDPQPTIVIGDVSQNEGTAGVPTPFSFNVTLSNASSQTITVDFATAPGTALSPADFAATSGTLTFTPGTTAQVVPVQVVADAVDEPNETFTVTLSNANANATIADGNATGTIVDDDGAPALTISDVTLAEGNAGTTNFVFNVTLAPSSGQTVTVNYTTQTGSATQGNDFILTAGTLTFVPGDTAESITVPVIGDTNIETDETFTVALSNPTLATLGDDTGLGTIVTDDIAPPTADLGITKAIVGTGPFVVGDNATFTITVTNNGPAGATNVRMLDAVPPGTTLVSATPSLGTCTGTITVDCNFGTLIANSSATVTLTLRLDVAGPNSNTATAVSDMTDPTPAAAVAPFTVVPAATGEAIPTLSQWMLIALASALAAAAALKLKP